jgi:predicted Na+-dependent transporter
MTRDKNHKVSLCAVLSVFLFLPLSYTLMSSAAAYFETPTAKVLIIIIIKQTVLLEFHSLFQSEFPTECDRVLPLVVYSIYSFLTFIR